jgi:hypothetical protein
VDVLLFCVHGFNWFCFVSPAAVPPALFLAGVILNFVAAKPKIKNYE